MGLVIVPDYIPDQINTDLDKLRDSLPEGERHVFEAEREIYYQQILSHISEYGTYPEIAGIEKTNNTAGG